MNVLKKTDIVICLVLIVFLFAGCGNDPRDNIVNELSEMYFGTNFTLIDDFAYRDPTTGAYFMSFHTYVFSNGNDMHCILAYDYSTDNDCCMFEVYYDTQINQDVISGYSNLQVVFYMDGRYETLD